MSFAMHMLDMLTNAYIRADIQKFEKPEPPETSIGKLFYLTGWGSDVLQGRTGKIRLWGNTDKMQRTVLDSSGNDYGIARGTVADEIFRIIIKIKVLAMLASGNLDTLILPAASLFGIKAEDVEYEEVYPVKVYIYINEDKLDGEYKNMAGVTTELANRIESGGIGIRIFYHACGVHKTTVYAGASACLVTPMGIPPTTINKRTEKQVKLKIGVRILLCVTASYSANRWEEFKRQERH